MSNERKIIESPWYRGLDETKPHRIDVSVWGTGPYATPIVTIFNEAGENITDTVLSGSASFSGSYLTTPDFVADVFTAGKDYLMRAGWQINGKAVSAFGWFKVQI